MAACNLKIQLDEPKKIRVGGEVLTGTVIVRCDKDTNCKGLTVCTRWTTHGRGNVDSGLGAEEVVFQGAWQAGQEYKYGFKLATASWPPTYFGTYLNVSHYVEARAKLAWATDPKASVEIPVVVTTSPADVQPSRKQSANGCGPIGWVLLGLILLVFAVAFIWLVPIIAIVAVIVWFFKSFLPKQLTGSIETKLEPRRVKAGGVVHGHLSFTPKRSVNINSINYKFTGAENCSSGSGSNRKSHKIDLSQQVGELAGTQRLTAGQLQSFDFEIKVPANAAPSMKLIDNEVVWTVELRVDIPKWPDWTETFTMIVEPSEQAGVESGRLEADQARSADEEWFDQVLEQLQGSTDAERLNLVLAAIREHEFKVTFEIEAELIAPKTNYLPEEPGVWLETYDSDRDLYVALFVPNTLVAPQIDTTWSGRIGVLDYISQDELLIARMLG